MKTITILLAIIGLVAITQFSMTLYGKYASGKNVLGGSDKREFITPATEKTSLLESNMSGESNPVAIPTLAQSVQLPATDLVDCWQKASDGTYQYNFGQLPKEECIAKVNQLKEQWEKEFSDTMNKQTDLNNKSSLIVPNDIQFK